MKLVIDIDDKTYKMIKNSTFFIENDKAFVAIRDGKPLPKGHGRLIDESKINWLIDPDVRWTTENRINSTSETVIEADKEEGEHMDGSIFFKDVKEIQEDLRKLEALQQEPKTDTWSIKDVANTLAKHGITAEQEPFINKPCVSSGVCEHDKNKVLDRIRAEIEARLCDVVSDYTDGYRTAIQGVLAIIDNYKEV